MSSIGRVFLLACAGLVGCGARHAATQPAATPVTASTNEAPAVEPDTASPCVPAPTLNEGDAPSGLYAFVDAGRVVVSGPAGERFEHDLAGAIGELPRYAQVTDYFFITGPDLSGRRALLHAALRVGFYDARQPLVLECRIAEGSSVTSDGRVEIDEAYWATDPDELPDWLRE